MARARRRRGFERWYDRYNRRYFAGRLARLPVVPIVDRMLPFRVMGLYIGKRSQLQRIDRDTKERRILVHGPAILLRVDGRRTEAEIRLTLLHEMTHVALGYHHGPRFERGMRRLARAGAFRGLW